MGDNAPSPIHRLLQRWRRDKAERLEEREWRRRIILASRRVQHVHLSLVDEFDAVRGLKSHLAESQPAIQRLEDALQRSQERFEALERSLRRHEEILGRPAEPVSVPTEPESVPRAREQSPDEKDELIRSMRAQLAASRVGLGEEELLANDLQDAGGRMEVRIEEMTGLIEELEEALAQSTATGKSHAEDHVDQLATSAARILEQEAEKEALEAAMEALRADHAESQSLIQGLEYKLSGLEGDAAKNAWKIVEAESDEEAQAAHQVEMEERCTSLQKELESIKEERDAEVTALAGRLRSSEMARIEGETRHTEDITQFADHSRERLEALMGELEIVRDALAESERERDSISVLAIEKERQVAELQKNLAQLCERNASLEGDAETVEAVQALIHSNGHGVEQRAAGLMRLMGAIDSDEDGVKRIPSSESRESQSAADDALEELPEETTLVDGVEESPGGSPGDSIQEG